MQKNLLMSNKVERVGAMLTTAIVIVKSTWRPWEKQQFMPTMLPQNAKIWLEVLHQTNL